MVSALRGALEAAAVAAFVFGLGWVVFGRTRNDPPPRRASPPPSRPTATAVPAPAARPEPEPAPEPPVATEPARCPADMVFVEGTYCEEAVHDCLRWLDDPKLPFARCAEYVEQARCAGKRRELRFCIDARELTPEGETLPANQLSFIAAGKACKERGKRLCLESEWTLACEGPELRPYPYGWSRQPKCNQDRSDLYEPNARRQILRDLRRVSGELAECKSPFGVYDMVGNVDELVQKDRGAAYPFRNALKGGWWMAGRNRCRPATTAHDDHYKDMQTGTRCCADVTPEP